MLFKQMKLNTNSFKSFEYIMFTSNKHTFLTIKCSCEICFFWTETNMDENICARRETFVQRHICKNGYF